MKVLRAGEAAIGARLLPQLIDAGHEVAATARSPEGLLAIEALGAKGVVDGWPRRARRARVRHEMTSKLRKAQRPVVTSTTLVRATTA